MIHAVRWNATTGQAERLGPGDLPRTHADLGPDEVVWIDLSDPTPAEEDRVFREFLPVHALTLGDITKPRREPEQGAHLPKVEEFPDYLFVVVNPLPELGWNPSPLGERGRGEGDPSKPNPSPDSPSPLTPLPGRDAQPAGQARPTGPGRGGPSIAKLPRPQLSAVVTHKVLVTHHYDPMPCVMGGLTHLDRHAENLRRGPDYVFHLVLDGIVDEYAPVVDAIAERLDDLETAMFERPTPAVLAELIAVKREVTYLRKTLILEREVLARLIRGEFELVDQREVAYYRNVYDHLVRYTDLIETAREMVSDLMQTHLAATSNKLNEVMKVLTTISTIGLLCALIAGIYGMNFDNMPELRWQYGYPFALGLMLLAAVGSLAYFRWKKWI